MCASVRKIFLSLCFVCSKKLMMYGVEFPFFSFNGVVVHACIFFVFFSFFLAVCLFAVNECCTEFKFLYLMMAWRVYI